MDKQRLDTGDVLALGIIEQAAPKTDIPRDRTSHDPREDGFGPIDPEKAETELDAGKLLDVPEYYGCVLAWKDERGYHGRLLQYRNLTEQPDFATAKDCVEWFLTTVAAVEG